MSQLASDDPTRSKLEAPLFVVAMLVVCGLAWSLAQRPALAVDPEPLAELPERLGRWRSISIPLEVEVERELRADFNVQRAYMTPGEAPIAVYIGYYGTERGGRPEHTPRFCYTGAGYGILAAQTLALSADEDLRATEYLVARDGAHELVHFWYRSHRRSGLLGGLDQNVDRMLGLLLDGRADGALVRISTPVHADDVELARSRLLSFGRELDGALDRHWPNEASDLRVASNVALPGDGPAVGRPSGASPGDGQAEAMP